MRKLRKLLENLRQNTCGNAALVVGVGMPALIGSAGLAVDVSQWFLWKNEMQFAVDQAALAGAWARTDSSTSSTYSARAIQEYDANVQIVKDFDSTPVVSLVSIGTGANNAVQVTASASKSLPFSSFVTGTAATVKVSARASISGSGTSFTGCFVALHPSMQGAFTLGGSASGSATCGVVALSNHPTAALVKNGNSTAQLGTLVAAGGIDAGFSSNGTMQPNTSGLSDPYSGTSAPNPSPSPARTYSCPAASAGTTTTTATRQVSTVTTYGYYTGNNSNQALTSAQSGTNTTTYSPATAGSSDPGTPQAAVSVPNGTTAGAQSPVTAYTYMRQVSTSPKKYEVKKVVTTTTYSNVVANTTGYSDGIARPSPGTYGAINIACQTIFAPGIYVVDTIDFGQSQVVTGDGVLFVIKTSNGMKINSQSNISLSGISQSVLETTYGYSTTAAKLMATMVIYDADSTDQIKINGNSTVTLNGIVYTPKREIWFNGNSAVSGVCMMVVANNITFTGTTDLSSFCIPAGGNILNAGGANPSVKLVL